MKKGIESRGDWAAGHSRGEVFPDRRRDQGEKVEPGNAEGGVIKGWVPSRWKEVGLAGFGAR